MNETDIQYKGVKGWLLLLCVNLAILDPFSILFNLSIIINVTKPYFDQQQGLLRLILINGTMSIGLAVFSIYTGISLWKVLPNAVKTAKKYLIAVFLYTVFAMYLPVLVGIPGKEYKEIYGNALFNGLLSMSYTAAWYLYINKSRRVKATYENKTS